MGWEGRYLPADGWDIPVEKGGRVGFRDGSAKRERRMETSLIYENFAQLYLAKKKPTILSACNCAAISNYP